MADAVVHAITGKRGYGKTTRLLELVHGAPRVVAWDPLVTRARPRGQLSMPFRFTDGEEAAEYIRAQQGRLLRCAVHSFFAGFDDQADDRDDWEPIVRAIVDTGGNCLLAIDEASTLCRRSRPHPALGWLLAYGRHIDVGVVWTAQRPAQVDHLCTGQAEIFESFRVTDGADLDALRGPFGSRVRELPSLPKYVCLSNAEE